MRLLVRLKVEDEGEVSYRQANFHSHGTKGARPAAGLHLGQGLLVEVGSLPALLEVALHLPVLGEVEGGDLLGLLDLLLVALDLALQLVNQRLHPLAVLLVLVLGVAQLLHASLGPPQILLSVSKPSVLRVQLRLQLTDSGLHLGQGLLSSLESVLLRLIQTSLGILDLSLQQLLVPLEH